MKKDSAFKLKSGNKPSIAKLIGLFKTKPVKKAKAVKTTKSKTMFRQSIKTFIFIEFGYFSMRGIYQITVRHVQNFFVIKIFIFFRNNIFIYQNVIIIFAP